MPSFAISDGFVVTPSIMPQRAPAFNSSRFAVSRKNFISSFDYGVFQNPNAIDFDAYGATWRERADARRRACGDQIARLQSHKRRNIGDYSIQRENHVLNRAVLFHLAVY